MTMSYRFVDLVDIDAFRAMLKSFYEATGILHGLVDDQNNVISAIGWQEACTDFHRVHPLTNARCQESNRYLAEHLGEGAYVGCACKNGLMDYATPIVVEGRQLATLYFGQVMHEAPDLGFFRRLAGEAGFDENAYLAAIRKVPVVARERIEPIMTFYVQLAQMLAQSGLDRLRQQDAERRLADLNRDLARRVEERTAELRKQAEFQRLLLGGLANVGLMIVVLENGRIVYHNDRHIGFGLGYAENDLAAPANFIDLVHPAERARVLETYRRRLVGEPVPETYDIVLLRKDGEGRAHELFVTTIPDTQPVQVLALARNISERKALEAAREAALAEAERLARMRSAFLSQMSHELRTPLNGILGYAQNLLREENLGERQIGGLNIIRNSGDHLLGLIDNILDHARLEADKLTLCPAELALGPFFRTVCALIAVRAEQKSLDFVYQTGPGVPRAIRADEQRLRQVLLNLLANAVNFTDRGRVSLTVSMGDAGRLRFEVRDSGIGIPAAQQEIIFEPFEQAGEARRCSGGTGLGLAISRQLVGLMGGEIGVESRVGEGSLFRFEIPVEIVDGAPLEMPVLVTSGANAERYPAPSRRELEIVHALAQRGNMGNIARHAEHLVQLDARYRPFAERLAQLAGAYRSRDIVAFVESYLAEETLP